MRVRHLGFLVLFILSSFHPGFAADGTSFDPVPIPIHSQGDIAVGTIMAWPSGSNPSDMGRWLECNGQPVPAGSQFDRLRAVLGGVNVPNFNGQFLRGTTGADVGQQVADSIRAHHHDVDPHQHTVSGSASGQGYSGTTSGASYYYTTAYVSGVWWPAIGTISGVDTVTGIGNSGNWGTTSGSNYSGSTSGGDITGYTNYAGGGPTHDTGGAETAPVHTKVRYLIRAIQ